MFKKIGAFIMVFILVVLITNSAASASACSEQAVFIYKITKVENGEYWGTGVYDDSNVYFNQEFIKQGDTIKVNDVVIAYFDPENIVDGLVEVEKAIPIGMVNSGLEETQNRKGEQQ